GASDEERRRPNSPELNASKTTAAALVGSRTGARRRRHFASVPESLSGLRVTARLPPCCAGRRASCIPFPSRFRRPLPDPLSGVEPPLLDSWFFYPPRGDSP